MIILYCDEHVMSITPGTCIECEKELVPVKYYNLDEIQQKINIMLYDLRNKVETDNMMDLEMEPK